MICHSEQITCHPEFISRPHEIYQINILDAETSSA